MAPQKLKKNCEYCSKAFFTYNPEMKFCNTDHEDKHEFNKKYYKNQKYYLNQYPCKQCGELSSAEDFCNEHCKRNYRKDQTTKRSKETFLKEKQNGKRLSYDVLNKMEEKKRVFEERWWNYNRCRERI